MRTGISILMLGCLLLCPLLVKSAMAGHISMVSLCEINAHPTRFNLTDVRVRALVMSDGIHRTLLIDESCHRKGVAFVVLQRSSDDAGVKQVMHAIYHDGPIGSGAFGKHIEATVSGIFLWEPNNSRAARRLLVESVSDVKVSIDRAKMDKIFNNVIHCTSQKQCDDAMKHAGDHGKPDSKGKPRQ